MQAISQSACSSTIETNYLVANFGKSQDQAIGQCSRGHCSDMDQPNLLCQSIQRASVTNQGRPISRSSRVVQRLKRPLKHNEAKLD
jgi:hypothetical protein